MSAENKREQPQWHEPTARPVKELLLNNSLTLSKVPFRPKEDGLIRWYACGPTVYDSAHLGHARAYVTFDIIRRILQDFFGYNVFYVMNITDVDDKIILRARRDFLFQRYCDSDVDQDTIIADAIQAFEDAAESHNRKVKALQAQIEEASVRQRRDELVSMLEQEKLKYRGLSKQQCAFQALMHTDTATTTSSSSSSREALLQAAKDVLSNRLDRIHANDVRDQKIFRKHAARFEKEFLEDMAMLNVREPDVLTRVSEYVSQIEEFVSEIISAGFAYESNGSVYFDVPKFSSSPGCDYAKLCPWSAGNQELVADGEGALSAGTSEKRSPSDFALWKKSKAGEPSWSSQWGEGRPGWHIECSAMASDILGETFDIHSGGEDLKFPHHDNEIAQSEARFGCSQWVNYFLHAGHLHIEGMKMSKSLKNFVTIREVLAEYTPRQIRLLFLLQGWDKTMSFSKQSLDEAVSKEQRLKEFFLSASVHLRAGVSGLQTWKLPEHQLHASLLETQQRVRESLLDNLNYPLALSHIFALLSTTNKYMSNDSVQPLLLKKICTFFTRLLRIFGVMGDDEIGLGSDDGNVAGANKESILAPVLDVITQFRDTVRNAVRSKQSPQEILQACDELRDVSLPDVGVRVEDVNLSSVWKLADAAAMRQERAEKAQEALSQALGKAESRLKVREAELDKLRHSLQDVSLFFHVTPPKYSAFDAETGVPIRNADGSEVSANTRKKLKKARDKFVVQREKACLKLEKEPMFEQQLQNEIEQLRQQIESLRLQKS